MRISCAFVPLPRTPTQYTQIMSLNSNQGIYFEAWAGRSSTLIKSIWWITSFKILIKVSLCRDTFNESFNVPLLNWAATALFDFILFNRQTILLTLPYHPTEDTSMYVKINVRDIWSNESFVCVHNINFSDTR